MAFAPASRGTGGRGSASQAGLRALALLLGIFLVAMGASKLAWLSNGNLLQQRLDRWASGARPEVRWYLSTVAIPGAPIFARLVPLGELATGAMLVLGLWPRVAAAVALFMALNFHFAAGSYWSWEFLRDGTGLPVIGALLALALGAARLPWTVRGG